MRQTCCFAAENSKKSFISTTNRHVVVFLSRRLHPVLKEKDAK